MGGLIYGLLHLPTMTNRVLEFALAATCETSTIYGDFNMVTVSEEESIVDGKDGSGRATIILRLVILTVQFGKNLRYKFSNKRILFKEK